MVIKNTYKPSLKDIMDKYYEMFRGKTQTKKQTFSLFNSPESPEHSDQDSDEDGWTRHRKTWVLSEEEWLVCERETTLSFIKITRSRPPPPR